MLLTRPYLNALYRKSEHSADRVGLAIFPIREPLHQPNDFSVQYLEVAAPCSSKSVVSHVALHPNNREIGNSGHPRRLRHAIRTNYILPVLKRVHCAALTRSDQSAICLRSCSLLTRGTNTSAVHVCGHSGSFGRARVDDQTSKRISFLAF